MQIWLIRHGQSAFNVAPSDGLDAGLTPLGRAQAQALARCIDRARPDLLLVSPMWRAVETAMLVLDAAPGLQAYLWPLLHERIGHDMQGYAGMAAERLASVHPRLAWWRGTPGACWWATSDECPATLSQRAGHVIAGLRALRGIERVAVITHNMFARQLLASMAPECADAVAHLRLVLAGINVVTLPERGPGRVLRLNDDSHLARLEQASLTEGPGSPPPPVTP